MNIQSKIRAVNAIRNNRFGELLYLPVAAIKLPAFSNILMSLKMIFIIIDCSISMNGNDLPPSRLQAAKEAAIEYLLILVKQKTDANVAVISFSDKAKLVAKPTHVTKYHYLANKINSIEIVGGTDIGAGLQKVLQVLSKVSEENHQSQIILLTDGHGGKPLKTANTLKEKFNAILDVVGIGGRRSAVNELLLKKVATTDPDGTCHYRFINDKATLKKHYRDTATGIVWKGDRK